MRTLQEIYIDFSVFVVEKTNDHNLAYDNLVQVKGQNAAHAFYYKSLLELLYDKNNGLYFFCKFVLGDLIHCGFPSQFRMNRLIRQWDKLVKSHKKLCVLAARGHSKSLFFSEILNIYDMFLFKHKRVLIISSTQEQANRIISEIKTLIENNEWLQDKKTNDRWAAETIGYNGGYILARGVGSEIRGEHVDRIVCDDILRSDNKLTDQEVEDYLDMTLMPMVLARDGQMVLVGTPFNSNDIFATIANRIREGSNWKMEKFPAIVDYDKKVLQCPDRFTWGDIMEKRLSMGALKFAREYQLEFFSRDISLFPKKIVEPALNKGKELTFLRKWTNFGAEWSIVCGVDVARAGTVSADYTVVIVLAYNNITQEKRIIYMWRSKGLKIREQAEEIAVISQTYNHPFFLVEKNNVGQELIDEMVDKYNLNVKEFLTGGKGQKKEELIRSLVMAFEHEQIVIPRGDEESVKVTNNLLDELERFCAVPTAAGNEQFKGVGTHDDVIMALAIANRATLEFGAPFAAGAGGNRMFGEYDSYIKSNSMSELEQLIKLGIIR